MNELKIFMFEDAQVRTVLINDEPWWIAVDICNILGLSNPSETMNRLDTDEKRTLRISEGGPEVNIINESGLYTLILRSSKPETRKFRKWVTSEILPTLRKTGEYSVKKSDDEMILIGYEKLLNKVKIITEQKEKAENQVKMLVHDFNKLYTTTEISKELNLKSAQELNNLLHDKKIQFKQSGTWVLYSDYSDKNYTSIKETVLDSGKIVYDRLWTGLGRQFILNLF